MDRREAVRTIEELLADRDNDSRYPCVSSPRHYEALDLAIEALQEKLQLSGETSTISEKESVEGVAESATTTDCNYTCSDCKHQDKTYDQEPCHSCFNNDGAGYEPDTDYISRQQAINAVENTDINITESEWDELINALNNLPPVNQKQITGKLESAENATSESEESTMGQPESEVE